MGYYGYYEQCDDSAQLWRTSKSNVRHWYGVRFVESRKVSAIRLSLYKKFIPEIGKISAVCYISFFASSDDDDEDGGERRALTGSQILKMSLRYLKAACNHNSNINGCSPCKMLWFSIYASVLLFGCILSKLR